MSFNHFITRNYLIVNPFNPDYNVNYKKLQPIDWYEYQNYATSDQKVEFYIDYQPDRKMIHNKYPIELEEEKNEPTTTTT